MSHRPDTSDPRKDPFKGYLVSDWLFELVLFTLAAGVAALVLWR